MAAEDLYNLCGSLLAACMEAVETTPGGAIDRAFVSPGNPAFDCAPQLTVHAGGPYIADTMPLQPPLQPAHRVGDGRALIMVAMTVTVLRCAPTLEQHGQTIALPGADDLDACAAEVLADCWAIYNHVFNLKRDGLLFGPKTREVIFDPAVPLNLAGATAGWQIQFRVQLNGYRDGS